MLGRPRPATKRATKRRLRQSAAKAIVQLDPAIDAALGVREAWSHKQGTPETHEHAARTNQGALARLWQSGAIDAEQLASAVEISSVAERIAADVAVKTASLETRIDSSRHGDGTFFEQLGQVRREVAYTRWRTLVGAPIAAVLDMIVGDAVGFTVVASRYRMHHRRAKKLLIDALDLWPIAMGTACREIDHEALQAAQARLLA